MKQKIFTFNQWKDLQLVKEAKSRSQKKQDIDRREFLKKLMKTTAVSALGGLAIGKLWDVIFNDYKKEDEQFNDAYLLRLSDNGRKIIKEFYEEAIPNFEDQLKIAEAELLIIFDDWVSKDINCRLNQKMYDSLVMIAIRWGREGFRTSRFIQEIKLGNFSKAVSELKKEQADIWYLEDLEEIKKMEVELLSSFEKSKTEDSEEETSGSTAGKSISKKKQADTDKNLITLRDTKYSRVKYDLDKTKFDKVNKELLDDLQLAAEKADITLTITTAKSGHRILTALGFESRHTKNLAVDISILNGQGSGRATNSSNGNPEFRKLGNKLKNELVKLGYTWNNEVGEDKAVFWQTNKGGNHFNHLHVSRKSSK